MSSPLKFATLLLALAAVASPALARDGRHGHDNDRGDQEQQDRRDDRRHDRRDDRRHDRYVVVPGWQRPAYRVPPPRAYRHRVAPQRAYYRADHRRWARGVRYNDYGYAPTYVVRDYGYYGLHSPPRGYYWRRDDRGEFLLVAIASGIIADLVLRGGY